MTYEELKAAYEAAVQKCSELEKENDELKKSNEDQWTIVNKVDRREKNQKSSSN